MPVRLILYNINNQIQYFKFPYSFKFLFYFKENGSKLYHTKDLNNIDFALKMINTTRGENDSKLFHTRDLNNMT